MCDTLILHRAWPSSHRGDCPGVHGCPTPVRCGSCTHSCHHGSQVAQIQDGVLRHPLSGESLPITGLYQEGAPPSTWPNGVPKNQATPPEQSAR